MLLKAAERKKKGKIRTLIKGKSNLQLWSNSLPKNKKLATMTKSNEDTTTNLFLIKIIEIISIG